MVGFDPYMQWRQLMVRKAILPIFAVALAMLATPALPVHLGGSVAQAEGAYKWAVDAQGVVHCHDAGTDCYVGAE